MRIGTTGLALAAVIAAGALAYGHTTTTSTSPRSSVELAADHVNGPAVEQLLTQVRIVDHLPNVPGYQRSCGKNKACSFGPAWTDNNTSGPGSHNGCDTRNDLLGSSLQNVTFKPGTHNCKVLSGVLNPDPYTGTVIQFDSKHPSAIQIDHAYPLGRAWDAGAATWPIEQRTAFANDLTDNLVAVDGRSNEQKSDHGLEWLPANTSYDCTYAQRYLTVAAKYHLDITRNDADIARRACVT